MEIFWNIQYIYYIDKRVLLENTQLVKLIRNYIRDSSVAYFPYIDDVISSFSCCLCKQSVKMASDRFVYIIKRKLHDGSKI